MNKKKKQKRSWQVMAKYDEVFGELIQEETKTQNDRLMNR